MVAFHQAPATLAADDPNFHYELGWDGGKDGASRRATS
jgi:hypothetical protein